MALTATLSLAYAKAFCGHTNHTILHLKQLSTTHILCILQELTSRKKRGKMDHNSRFSIHMVYSAHQSIVVQKSVFCICQTATFLAVCSAILTPMASCHFCGSPGNFTIYRQPSFNTIWYKGRQGSCPGNGLKVFEHLSSSNSQQLPLSLLNR